MMKWMIRDDDLISGLFIVPVSGTYRVSYSLRSWVDTGNRNSAFIYIAEDENEYYTNMANMALDIGDALKETAHCTYSEWYKKDSTGGREATIEVSAGNVIFLRASSLYGNYQDISFCVDYIPKI